MKNITYISAGAGSGKTYTLTERLATLIKDGKAKPSEIILTTFTKKAAGEFREKAKAKLFEHGMYKEGAEIDQALVGTLHSVAEALINKYWFKLGLPPHMGVMDDDDTEVYTSQSLALIPTDDELKVLHDFSREFEITKYEEGKPSGINYDYWQELLLKIIGFSTNYEIGNYERSIKESLGILKGFVIPNATINFAPKRLERLFEEHKAFLDGKSGNENEKRKAALKALAKDLRRPTVAWYRKLHSFVTATVNSKGPLAELTDELSMIWNSPEIYDMQERYIRLLFDLAQRWRKSYADFKKNKRLLDFNDLEKYMLKLLDNEETAREIGNTYRYVFVDEFQDSSPIQIKIFHRLAEVAEHSYWVGDIKQAIYGFRGTDIDLISALVNNIHDGKDGCSKETLDTSYRSLPDIVDVCNKVFTQTFDGVLPQKNVVLKPFRENTDKTISMRFIASETANNDDFIADIADNIANMVVNEGIKPKDIAVLAQKNSTLHSLAVSLSDGHHIPCSLNIIEVKELRAYQLLVSLLQLIVSGNDSLAKAQIAFLTVKDFTVKSIIDSKLENDGNAWKYLYDVPLVRQTLELKEKLCQQSVSAMVETMVIELGLMDVAQQWTDARENIEAMKVLTNKARGYEQRCANMGIPATAAGLMDYFEQTEMTLPEDEEGVQLVTYHLSKGLQWKHVIMLSLNESRSDEGKCITNDFYGVHFVRTAPPSSDNIFPEVFIRLLPMIYGNSTKCWENILQTIRGKGVVNDIMTSNIQEANRLMYVGMTRAEDMLTLAVRTKTTKGKNPLEWFESIGLKNVATDFSSKQVDCLGVGMMFEKWDCPADAEDLKYEKDDSHRNMVMTRTAAAPIEIRQRNVAPSEVKGRTDNISYEEIGDRIPIKSTRVDMATIGSCIHHILCCADKAEDDKALAMKLSAEYKLRVVLTDTDKIIEAWDNLKAHLEKKHGKAVKVYHERPFTHLYDGQIFTGSMDLVWQTEQGDILVDFKSNPMKKDDVLNDKSEHYVGLYAGQLECYRKALEAVGHKVLASYIYYPVTGLLVEFK